MSSLHSCQEGNEDIVLFQFGRRHLFSFQFGRRHYEVLFRVCFDAASAKWSFEYGASLYRADHAEALRHVQRDKTTWMRICAQVQQTAQHRFHLFPQRVLFHDAEVGGKQRYFWRKCFARYGMRFRQPHSASAIAPRNGCFKQPPDSNGAKGAERRTTLPEIARLRCQGSVCESYVYDAPTARVYTMYHHLEATRELVLGFSVASHTSAKSEAAAWFGRAKIDAQHWHRAHRDMCDSPRIVALHRTEDGYYADDDIEAHVRSLCVSVISCRTS